MTTFIMSRGFGGIDKLDHANKPSSHVLTLIGNKTIYKRCSRVDVYIFSEITNKEF
jgi:hypothetical protein